jgi:ribosomal protein L32
MPRYDVRNDGIGPFAVFYCDQCSREYRSTPDVGGAIVKDIGRQAASDMLRRLPIFGQAVADNLVGEDPRYSMNLNAQQLEAHWRQVKEYFRECPTCHQILCLSDFDEQSGTCREDSPRANEIAQAQAEQAANVAKGIANVFGFGEVIKQAGAAAQRAAEHTARCPECGTLAQPGTKFCPDCGKAMLQPEQGKCASCGALVGAAKFCPECGARVERAAAPAAECPSCGAETRGAKFCPECGARVTG